jgi:hypothetical protein
LSDKRRRPPSLGGVLQAIGLGLLALVVGVLGFIPVGPIVFLGPVRIAEWGKTDFALFALTLGIYVVGGALIGYLKPGVWFVAAVLAWVAVITSTYNLVSARSTPSVRSVVPLALLLLFLPLAVSLGGAYFGRVWRRWEDRTQD